MSNLYIDSKPISFYINKISNRTKVITLSNLKLIIPLTL